jgi:hypothetical protein
MGFDHQTPGGEWGGEYDAETLALEEQLALGEEQLAELHHQHAQGLQQPGEVFGEYGLHTAVDPYAAPATPTPAAPATPELAQLHLAPELLTELAGLQLAPGTTPTDATAAAPTPEAATATAPRITINDDIRITPSGTGIEVYFTLKNEGTDLPVNSGLQTYLQVVGLAGSVLVDRHVGMGEALASGATHFGGDTLAVAPQECTVFVYANYKADGTYDDLKSKDYQPTQHQ